MQKRILISLAFVLLILSGCGSSGSSSEDDSNEQSLAEASANLPKTGVINVGGSGDPEGDTSAGTTTGADSASPSSDSASPSVDGSTDVSFSMRRFLWKPISEGDGNVVVLVDTVGVRVEVFGSISETLIDFGPSNGRGTTARGSFPGCSYGSGIQLRFFASNGRRLGFADGTAAVTIPNGCDRVEFDL